MYSKITVYHPTQTILFVTEARSLMLFFRYFENDQWKIFFLQKRTPIFYHLTFVNQRHLTLAIDHSVP